MRFGIIKLHEPGQAFCAGFNAGEVVILTECAKPGHIHAKRYPSRAVPDAAGEIPVECVIEVENPAAYLQELHELSGNQWQLLEEVSVKRDKLSKDCDDTATLYRSALRLLELSTINK